MALGVVRWFNNAKGFGFILPDEGSEELFARFLATRMASFKAFKESQRISFEVA